MPRALLTALQITGTAGIAVAALITWRDPVATVVVLISGVALLTVLLYERRETARFLARASAALEPAAGTPGWRDTRILTPTALVVRLGALTRNHTQAHHTGYLALAGQKATWVGGFGLDPQKLHLDRLSRVLLRRARADGHIPADELLCGELHGWALPLWQGSHPVGLWLVADPEPVDPAELRPLADWIGTQLHLNATSTATDLLEAERLRRLLGVSSAERSRQALYRLPVPLLLADLSGEVQFASAPMDRILRTHRLAGQSSLRGALYHMRVGDEDFDAMMRGLFANGLALELQWSPIPDAWAVRVEPLPGQGYLLTLLDESAGDELVALQSAVAQLAGVRARITLEILRQRLPESAARHLLELDATLADLRDQATLRVEPSRALEPAPLLRELLAEVRPLMDERGIRATADLPPLTHPVRVPPVRTREGLADLLRHAARWSTGEVVVQLSDWIDHCEVLIRWEGGPDPDGLDHPDAVDLSEAHRALDELDLSTDGRHQARVHLRR